MIQRKGIDPTWTVQMVAAIHISLDEANRPPGETVLFREKNVVSK